MVKRAVTSLNLDPHTWREGKKRAIDLHITMGEYMEQLIKKDLK